MKKISKIISQLCVLVVCFSWIAAPSLAQEEKLLFDFEQDMQRWEIPDWALEKTDLVTQNISKSSEYADTGVSSLRMMVSFPGGYWTGAIVEIMEYFDWTAYSTILANVYLPEAAPEGLRARLVLTVGENWQWTEMSGAVRLVPGEWTTISADLLPGSTDWKRIQPTDEFRADVRKMAIRIESNMKPAYTGPIYIDNIRLREIGQIAVVE